MKKLKTILGVSLLTPPILSVLGYLITSIIIVVKGGLVGDAWRGGFLGEGLIGAFLGPNNVNLVYYGLMAIAGAILLSQTHKSE